MNKYEQLLKEIYDNPKLGNDLKLGIGADRIAYRMGTLAIKISKISMIPYNNNTGSYEIPHCGDKELIEYFSHLYKDYGGYQTEEELDIYNQLTEEEKELFIPILDTGSFMDAPYTVAPVVKTGKDLGEYNFIDMCKNRNLDYNFELLEKVSKKFNLEYGDMVTNNGNFGLTEEGKPVVLDFGLSSCF